MGREALERHNLEIAQNLHHWERKPLLRQIYRGFHELIRGQLAPEGLTVELGSGIGKIKDIIPDCLTTDVFPNRWLDQTESAYRLSFADGSVANLILFDIFHHLRYPGTALLEFRRVLRPGGRVVIFEPCISLLGWLVYGLLHTEPVGSGKDLELFAPDDWTCESDAYYAAQINATTIFMKGRRLQEVLGLGFSLRTARRFAAVSYVASGGYSGPQLYPCAALPVMRGIDAVCGFIPGIFATRLLVVLEKLSCA